MKRTVYISDEVWKQTRKRAIDESKSASQLIEEALSAYLNIKTLNVKIKVGGSRVHA